MRSPRSRSRSARALAVAIAITHAWLAGTPAAAAPTATSGAETSASTPADVDSAEDLYAKLDYEHANEAAKRALDKGGLSHDDVVRTYRVLAITNAILGSSDASRDAFFELLTCEPTFEVDTSLGPKVTAPFSEAKGRFRSLLTVPGIDVSTSIDTAGGTLKITARNPTRVAKRVVVGYRWGASGAYVTETAASDTTTNIDVAAAPTGRSRLDYYATALDAKGNVVFETGNTRAPKSFFAEEHRAAGAAKGKKGDDEGSFIGSTAFWLLAGAVVAGGGTALYFGLRPSDPPTSASLLPILTCGTDRCR